MSRLTPWLAGLAWALLAATRTAVVVAAPTPQGPSVWWVWPAGWVVLAWGVGAGLGWLAAWRLQVTWLRRRGSGRPREAAARSWRPALALFLLPALELCAPLYRLSLAPLLLSRSAWPVAAAASLVATGGLTLKAREAACSPPAVVLRRGLVVGVFGLALCLAAAWGWRLEVVARAVGPFSGGDEPRYLLLAHSLAVDHDLDLADNLRLRESFFFDKPGGIVLDHQRWTPGGSLYSKFRPGLPLLLAPFYAWALAAGLPVWSCVRAGLWLVFAWLAAEVFLLCRQAVGRNGPALVGVAALSLCLPATVYSNLVFPEVAAAAALTAGFRRLRQGDQGWPAMLAASLCLAWLPWLHERFLLPAVVLAALALVRRPWGCRRLGLVVLWLPVLVSAGLLMAYFQAQYGRPWPTARVHAQGVFFNPRGVWEGISGLWVDAAEGLLTYAPVWLAGLAGLGRLVWRRAGGWWAVALVAAVCVPAALFADWHGGINPPSRYLVAALPWLALGLAAGLAWAPRRFALGVVVLLGLSLAGSLVVWRFPSAVYGHRVVLDDFLVWPLFSAWLPTWLLGGKSAGENAAQAGLWLGLAAGVGVWLAAGREASSPRGSALALLVGMVVVLVVAGAADRLGPGVWSFWGREGKLRVWGELAALGPPGGVWRAGPSALSPREALVLHFPPARYAHRPARSLARPAGAVLLPPGEADRPGIWGQYLRLPPGRYRAVARLEAAPGARGARAWMDVAAERGRRILVRREVAVRGGGQEVGLYFSLPRAAGGVELRLGNRGGGALVVRSLELHRCPASP